MAGRCHSDALPWEIEGRIRAASLAVFSASSGRVLTAIYHLASDSIHPVDGEGYRDSELNAESQQHGQQNAYLR